MDWGGFPIFYYKNYVELISFDFTSFLLMNFLKYLDRCDVIIKILTTFFHACTYKCIFVLFKDVKLAARDF